MPEWLRAWFDPRDLVQSRKLVEKLNLPGSTSQFVLALRPRDSPESVVYLLSSLHFSEKAVADVRELIAATQPKAVVALVDLEAIEYFREEEKLAAEDSGSFGVPTSVLGVIQENIARDPNVVPYRSRARIELGKSIFGTLSYGDILEAKASAAKVKANFRYIDFPYRSSGHLDDPAGNDDEAAAGEPDRPSAESSRQNFLAAGNLQNGVVNYKVTRRETQGLRSFVSSTSLNELRQWRESSSVALAQMFDQNRSWSDASSSEDR